MILFCSILLILSKLYLASDISIFEEITNGDHKYGSLADTDELIFMGFKEFPDGIAALGTVTQTGEFFHFQPTGVVAQEISTEMNVKTGKDTVFDFKSAAGQSDPPERNVRKIRVFKKLSGSQVLTYDSSKPKLDGLVKLEEESRYDYTQLDGCKLSQLPGLSAEYILVHASCQTVKIKIGDETTEKEIKKMSSAPPKGPKPPPKGPKPPPKGPNSDPSKGPKNDPRKTQKGK